MTTRRQAAPRTVGGGRVATLRILPQASSAPTTSGHSAELEVMPVAPNAMKKYMCLICGYIYDEAIGAPDEGIAAGTRWEDVPPNWTCPECGARKEDFEMIEL
jgi:rubredoxin